MQKIVIIFFLGLLISSCCTTRVCKVERAEKKIFNLTQKFPELQLKDTIVLNDTIRIQSISVDTSFFNDPFSNSDTIIITKDKIKIQYIRQDSIIFLTGECIGDTIFIETKVPFEKIIVRELTFAERAKDWAMFIFAISMFLLVLRIFFKDIFSIFR
tara:strand:+ start:12755 stop:13225 length:471 start_codon:yes stop_codon:yes gene_type:complete